MGKCKKLPSSIKNYQMSDLLCIYVVHLCKNLTYITSYWWKSSIVFWAKNVREKYKFEFSWQNVCLPVTIIPYRIPMRVILFNFVYGNYICATRILKLASRKFKLYLVFFYAIRYTWFWISVDLFFNNSCLHFHVFFSINPVLIILTRQLTSQKMSTTTKKHY